MKLNLPKKLLSISKPIIFGCSLMGSTLLTNDVQAQLIYCTPNMEFGCSEGDEIDDFSIPSIGFFHEGTGCSYPVSYTDYSGDITRAITLPKGLNFDYIIKSGYVDGQMMIWIDFNNDGVFSMDERIGATTLPTMVSTTEGYSYTQQLSVPNTVANGTYRMRVGYQFDYLPEPCGSEEEELYGEFHDYSVTIVDPPCDVPTYTYAVVEDCGEGEFSVNFNFTDLGDADSIIVKYGSDSTVIYSTGAYSMGPFTSSSIINFEIKHPSYSVCNTTISNVVSGCGTICLSGARYPSHTIYLSSSGGPELVYDDLYAGEYLVVLLNEGITYDFSSTIISDNLTFATNAMTPVGLLSGNGVVTFSPSTTGEYRVYVHSNAACGTEEITRDIYVQCTMSCTRAVVDYELVNDCTNNEFYVLFSISSLGSASELVLSDGTTNENISSTGTYPMGPYITGTVQNFSLTNDYDTLCDKNFLSITSVCSATNDNISDAITLTLGAGCSEMIYSNIGATADDEPESPITSYVGDGVWFNFVAPASGAVRISTDGFEGTLADTRITLFSASDPSDYSTFVVISADDDNGVSDSYGGIGNGYLSTLFTTALTPGTTYYVKVEGFDAGEQGTFCISIDELNSSMIATSGDCYDYLQGLYGDKIYTGEMSIVDANGKLVAILRNSAGASMDEYEGRINVHSGAIREDILGQKYLNRNTTFVSSEENVEVQLFFLDSEIAAADMTLSDLNITKVDLDICTETVDGSDDRILITPTSYGSTGGLSWLKFTTPSFSSFFIGASSRPLSVKLGDIKATNKGTINVIEWNTLSADGTETMTLERSADAQNFYPIHTVQSSNQPASYTYDDVQPISGVNFYRLAMKDANGTLTYSKVVNATMQATQANIQIFPNPTDKSIQVKLLNSNSHATITIVDMTGKVVKQIENIVDASIEIDVQDLPHGHYILKYNDGRTQEIFKVTKL